MTAFAATPSPKPRSNSKWWPRTSTRSASESDRFSVSLAGTYPTPAHSRWRSSTAPRASRAVKNGHPRCSIAAASPSGRSQNTSSPSTITGRLAPASAEARPSRAASSSPGRCRTNSTGGAGAAGPASTSTGISRNTGPGRPAHMIRQADSRYSGIRSVWSTRAAHLVTGDMMGRWSADMPAPRSNATVFACAPNISSGVPAIFDTSAAVTVLVTPGPRVTAATPGVPVTRATPSAMNAAAASCRVCTRARSCAAAA